MDCKHCEEYQGYFKIMTVFKHARPGWVAVCPNCLGWTDVNIEFDPPRYRATMD